MHGKTRETRSTARSIGNSPPTALGRSYVVSTQSICGWITAKIRQRQPRSITSKLYIDGPLGAKADLAISTRRFVSGVQLSNVSHYPLVAVSHVSPGVQLADIGAYILGRRAAGDHKFNVWIQRLRNLEWSGEVDGRNRMGIQRYQRLPNGEFKIRKRWE